MALIGAILVEIKIIEILCKRSLREGDRYALNHGIYILAAQCHDNDVSHANAR